MACYTQIAIPAEIEAMNPTTEEKQEVLRRIGLPNNLGYIDGIIANMDQAMRSRFMRELRAVRAIATAKREGYRNIREERQGEKIVIRVSD